MPRKIKNAANKLAAKRIKYQTSFLNPRNRIRGPWPDHMDTQLRYYDTISVNAAAGGIALHVFRANSVFDPDFTGTGHQPRGYDQWTGMYNKYVVTASRIRVTAMYSGSGNAGVAFVSTNTNSAPYGSDLDVMEDDRIKYQTVSQFERANLNQTYIHGDYFISDPYDDDNAGALTTANPFNTSFFIVGAGCLNTSQDPGDFTLMCQIDYKVRFYDHVEPADS